MASHLAFGPLVAGIVLTAVASVAVAKDLHPCREEKSDGSRRILSSAVEAELPSPSSGNGSSTMCAFRAAVGQRVRAAIIPSMPSPIRDECPSLTAAV